MVGFPANQHRIEEARATLAEAAPMATVDVQLVLAFVKEMRTEFRHRRVQAVTAERALDFVLYVAIALALVASIIWAAATLGDAGVDRFWRWVVLSGSAALVFGYALPPFRTSMRRPPFGPSPSCCAPVRPRRSTGLADVASPERSPFFPLPAHLKARRRNRHDHHY